MRRNTKYILFTLTFLACIHPLLFSQIKPDIAGIKRGSGTEVKVSQNRMQVSWPSGKGEKGQMILNLATNEPLFNSFSITNSSGSHEIASNLDPAFILTIGKRDLVSQNGWNIFFDKTPGKPHSSHNVLLQKQTATAKTDGARTIITIGTLSASHFRGDLEITLYKGSPFVNIAAVMTTDVDSTAIIYDAALVSSSPAWKSVNWSDTEKKFHTIGVNAGDTSRNLAVKYRTIIGEGKDGSLAIFPAPHQYFYPLDEAFNLNFTWYGNNYRNMIPQYGMGIRQDLQGDRRYVPWFNSPPGTRQRLNFFCMLSADKPQETLDQVKRLTNDDSYAPIEGYKTMTSHFHNEFVVKVMIANKELPDTPSFKKVFKDAGVDIVHLGEFHYTAHPRGPDELRLLELKYMFDMCEKYSDSEFLLLPGEEPNEFLGGHWLQFFPKPVYWIMSRRNEKPFVTNDPVYGKVYRIGNKEEMLKLLEQENGLAWTAHARTKGSTGYPDKYKEEEFFKSKTFFGAAWKPIPADLSVERLGKRILDLMDDMANWGHEKYAIGEADLFTIEPHNEMYAHLNVNYLKMDKLPSYSEGWQPVIDAMSNGRFFVSTGEVLIPEFDIDGKESGDTLQLNSSGKANINFSVKWTFPLKFAEVISGDGKEVFRERIDLRNTEAFGNRKFQQSINLKGRKWARLEVWDEAVNGAFTQFVWLAEK